MSNYKRFDDNLSKQAKPVNRFQIEVENDFTLDLQPPSDKAYLITRPRERTCWRLCMFLCCILIGIISVSVFAVYMFRNSEDVPLIVGNQPMEYACTEPISTGEPCPKSEFHDEVHEVLRWAYSPQSKDCVPIWYLGCKGTRNMFVSQEACRNICMQNGQTENGVQKQHPTLVHVPDAKADDKASLIKELNKLIPSAAAAAASRVKPGTHHKSGEGLIKFADSNAELSEKENSQKSSNAITHMINSENINNFQDSESKKTRTKTLISTSESRSKPKTHHKSGEGLIKLFDNKAGRLVKGHSQKSSGAITHMIKSEDINNLQESESKKTEPKSVISTSESRHSVKPFKLAENSFKRKQAQSTTLPYRKGKTHSKHSDKMENSPNSKIDIETSMQSADAKSNTSEGNEVDSRNENSRSRKMSTQKEMQNDRTKPTESFISSENSSNDSKSSK